MGTVPSVIKTWVKPGTDQVTVKSVQAVAPAPADLEKYVQDASVHPANPCLRPHAPFLYGGGDAVLDQVTVLASVISSPSSRLLRTPTLDTTSL
jgi:hypothetical protein